MVERKQEKLNQRQFDYNKCPLLSKPGDAYIKKLNKKSSPRSLTLFNEYNMRQTQKNSLVKSSSSLNMCDTFTELGDQALTKSSCLRNIYPKCRVEGQYEKFFILEAISDIFVSFTIAGGVKIMSHTDFRAFVKYVETLFHFYKIII